MSDGECDMAGDAADADEVPKRRAGDGCPQANAAPGKEHLMPYGEAAKGIFVRANGILAYNKARGLPPSAT
jgi:hypothetical protein